MFAHGMPTTRFIVSISCSRQDTPFTALELLSSIALERFGVRGQLASNSAAQECAAALRLQFHRLR
jgi:hypothetical protein